MKKVAKNTKRKPKQCNANTDDLAVIGMACRFPGAKNYTEFWRNLTNGVNSVTEIPKTRWDWRAYFGDPNKTPGKTNIKYGGFIDDIDKFDAAFFRHNTQRSGFTWIHNIEFFWNVCGMR